MNKTRIKFGAAYMVEPTFVRHKNEDIFHEVSANTLSISEGLEKAIAAWDFEYQETLNTSYPPESGFKTKLERDRHVQAGLELTTRLRQELGQNYLVEYLVPP